MNPEQLRAAQKANYDSCDMVAASLVETSKYRIVFISQEPSGWWSVSYNSVALNYPVKRYRRLSTGAIEVKAVTTWRRN